MEDRYREGYYKGIETCLWVIRRMADECQETQVSSAVAYRVLADEVERVVEKIREGRNI